MSELTQAERDRFDATIDVIQHPDASIGLVRARLDGEDVAVIVEIEIGIDRMAAVRPLAIIVTDAMFDRLEQP